ncbi:MAG TPA: hypothetical protein VK835_09255 [Bacteroidia bacterium]|jgi:hypothetical protein|nr:hypothetical protein [Bacteroidia bacterium]
MVNSQNNKQSPFKDWVNRQVVEIKKDKYSLLFLLVFLIGVLSYSYFKSRSDVKKIEADKATVYGVITGTQSCFKNGKCLNYTYTFEGKNYSGSARITHTFCFWCEKKDDCRGMKVRIELEKSNPENRLIYWEELYEN